MPGKPGTVDNPYHYGATGGELEKFLLLCMFVAGKKASIQQQKLEMFIAGYTEVPESSPLYARPLGDNPLKALAKLASPEITGRLRISGVGQYRRLTEAIRFAACKVGMGQWDLSTVTRDQLVECPGVGLKTASFFLMYTREALKDKLAVLDTHILRWLREEEGENTPKSTPQGNTYLRLEHRFLEIAKQRGTCPSILDFEIWKKYRDYRKKKKKAKGPKGKGQTSPTAD